MSEKTIKVTLVKGLRGVPARHRLSVKALGLKRINHTVSVPDNGPQRGLINAVQYLLKVEQA